MSDRTESGFLEHRFGTTGEEGTRIWLPADGNRVSVDRSSTFGGDDAKQPCKGGCRDSTPPPVTINEKAGDPPVGLNQTQPAVGAHPARDLGGRSELAPSDNLRPIVNEGSVRLIRPNKFLFECLVPSGRSCPLAGRVVEGHAPAATPYAIVLLNNLDEVRLCLRPEFLD